MKFFIMTLLSALFLVSCGDGVKKAEDNASVDSVIKNKDENAALLKNDECSFSDIDGKWNFVATSADGEEYLKVVDRLVYEFDTKAKKFYISVADKTKILDIELECENGQIHVKPVNQQESLYIIKDSDGLEVINKLNDESSAPEKFVRIGE